MWRRPFQAACFPYSLDITRRLLPFFVILFGACSVEKDDGVVQPPPVNLPVGHHYPAWSVDGDSLYYMDRGITQINPDGGYSIDPDSAGMWVTARDSQGERMILNSGAFTYTLAPDGSAVCMAFGGDLHLGVFVGGKLDDSTFEQITSIGGVTSPSWSPAGDWIAFDSNYNDPRGAQAVWKIRTDETELTDLSVHGQGEWLQPSWDTTGTKLVYVRYVDDTSRSEIFVMDATGENSERLTRNNAMDISPRYSPDGAHICYESYASSAPRIYIMNADGSGKRALVTGSMPAWSPDGSEIAYVALTGDVKTNGTVWIAKTDGSGRYQVTESRIP